MAIINGTSASERLDGTAESDLINLVDGNDTCIAGTGNDTVYGGNGDDQLYARYVGLTGDDGNDHFDGGAGNDSIYAGTGQDTLIGDSGNDMLSGEDDNDSLMGGDGNDSLYGGTGNDTLDGGTGNDTLYGNEGDDSLIGGDGDDYLWTDVGNDTLTGGVGKDSLYGGDGNDSLDGGDGDDYLQGDAGNDTLIGGLGNDSLSGGDGNDSLRGETGDDSLSGGDGDDYLTGDDGNDTCIAGLGSDTVYGGNGDDKLYARSTSTTGDDGNDSFDGGAGNDYLAGGTGNDTLLGGIGNDALYGEEGDDSMDGGDGADSLYGGTGNDTLLGGIGNDTLYGEEGNDSIDGGDGADSLYGGTGNDTLIGGTGNDTLYGEEGDDSIDGGDGGDYLWADVGNDTLIGSAGNDTLLGGSGNDYYVVRDRNTYVYDQAGSDRGLIYANFYKPPSSVEGWSWAPGTQKLPYWIDALLPDDAARYGTLLDATKTLYYCFPTTVPAHFTKEDLNGLSQFNEQQKAFAKQALAYIATVIDVRFVETTNAGALNTIDFSNNIQADSAGYAKYPNDEPGGSDLFLNSSGTSSRNLTPREGDYSALTIIHELGHALGMKHPFGDTDSSGNQAEPPYLPGAEDSTQWTVMSYKERAEEYYLRYSSFDIAALQYLYGPNPSQRTGDDRYFIRSDSSNFIWDGGGKDTIDASALSTPVTLYLEPGYWGYAGTKAALVSSPGQITVNFGTIIENATGGAGSDTIVGNSADNSLTGGAGNDTLDGGLGNDLLIGGEGIDNIVLHGIVSQYQFSLGTDNAIVTGPEGVDTLSSIENIRLGSSSYITDIALSDAITSRPIGLAKQITDLYVAYFNRGPDTEGFDYWFHEIYTGTKALRGIAEDFSWSNEYLVAYPSSLTNRQFVEKIYQNLFDRSPDQGGWDYWTARLDTGSVKRAGFILDVIEGAYAPTSGPQDRTLIDNKHDVSLYYTGQMAMHPQEGYDIAIADLLNRVTGDVGTVAAAERVMDYAFDYPVTLAGVMTNQTLFNALWV